MKRIIISIVALSIISLVRAQNISIGPTASFGHSWIFNPDHDGTFNPMWSAGISFTYSTKTNFGIGADIKYSAEGNETTYQTPGPSDGPVDVTSTINTNYIRVPLKLIYFFCKRGSVVRPKIYAGPSFGFLTSANEDNNYPGTTINIKDKTKHFDFGVTAAAGLNFRLASRTWLNADLAFYQGLSDIAKNSNTTQHNGNLGLNAGLLFGL